ncbi:hypothetical protein EIP91_004411 [Steccherinum ochraceum]|uniref:Alpha/beta hydrolase fold-3 domain-containing protein n=1 Tax=Steccherinum ochraceum TaxID=92696 RepID=A0A4R0RN61_9APHY|nr:hypothetical protein EIP91_004411 [Steccherinum ochraceum]
MSPNSQYSTPDPEWAAIVSVAPAREVPKDPEVVRAAIRDLFIEPGKKNLEPQLPDASTYSVADYTVPHDDGATSRIRVITPAPKGRDSVACIAWIYGGGFIGGNIEYDDYRMRIISGRFHVAAVLLEYRLAPEHPFPTSAYDGLKWMAENAPTLGMDLAKGFILGGTSAGGNIAASLAHRVQQDALFEGKRLTGSILTVPTLLHPLGYPEEFRDDLQSINMPEGRQWTIVNGPMIKEMFVETLQAPPTDPEASPLLYPNRAVLPPTYLQIAGLDPLRDEGILYERLIREAGVKTRISIYPGVPHGFHLPAPQLIASKKLEEDLREGVAWLLGLHAHVQ